MDNLRKKYHDKMDEPSIREPNELVHFLIEVVNDLGVPDDVAFSGLTTSACVIFGESSFDKSGASINRIVESFRDSLMFFSDDFGDIEFPEEFVDDEPDVNEITIRISPHSNDSVESRFIRLTISNNSEPEENIYKLSEPPQDSRVKTDRISSRSEIEMVVLGTLLNAVEQLGVDSIEVSFHRDESDGCSIRHLLGPCTDCPVSNCTNRRLD